MTDVAPDEEATLFPRTAGERLREAREAQGLSLAEIAARTRVPVRQLEAIETSNFAVLPSITYSVGFAKAYARAVGVDEAAIGREVRGHSEQAPPPRRAEYEAYTDDERAARTPPRGLVIGALLVALLVLVGAGLWYGTTLFRYGGDAAPATATVETTVPEAPVAAAPAPPAAAGPVILTATDEVWLKVYDADRTLFQDTLKAGERYEVPVDAANPMINVGRPDKLQVTVGGATVAPLGDGRVAIKDVAIGAAALIARGTAQPAPSATATPAAAVPSAQRRVSIAPPSRERRAATSGAPLNIASPATVAPEPAAPRRSVPQASPPQASPPQASPPQTSAPASPATPAP